MKRFRDKISLSGCFALSAYIAFISWRLFFYAYGSNNRVEMEGIRYNLIPFRTIMNYLQNSGQIDFTIWIYNLAGNIVAFMPLGFLIPFAVRGMKAGKTYLVAFALILSAEIMQLISRRGVFDIDDLILNMLGCLLGYSIYRLIGIISYSRR